MRIVITGASGNVGTALLHTLTAAGGHELVGIVRRPPPPEGVYQHVDWQSLDLAALTATAELERLFEGADAVVHLAWGFQPTHNIDYLRQLALGGTKAVLDAAHHCGVGQLVHMSSVGTYAAGRYCHRVDESWSTAGIPTSPYSRHKSAAEAMLDRYERQHGDNAVPIARARPGFIVQRAAASGLMRYSLPAYVPMRLVPLLPLLPLDHSLCIPLIHADDVADGLARMIERRAVGPFNLAAEPPVNRDDVAHALHARAVHLPSSALGRLVDLSWRLRLQPVDRGWLDMAFSVPLLDCTRARTELQWKPTWSSTEALADVLDGIAARAHTDSAPLRRRSAVDLLRRSISDGLISSRREP
ncbi:NAD-dependent epimerase/dehydratase family protein [Mycolicibacterium mengxianglii]|uniref:NAD-dependent epimerase/dehydratase family protein n=1 Tax=Mycolicibacterium mengxianglii TaxID=2736649 RepID=UPI0018EEF9D1|nr:NAD-dependent epimerase/dehydratase family protein [Mycolicibacterium mengxianglii]